MMKTRTILLIIAIMGCFASAAAPSIQFFDYAPAKTYAPDYTSKHENNYVAEWNVNQVCRIDGEYVVGLFWEDNVPSNFKARRQV